MPQRSVIGFSGNFTRPSKTRGFVAEIVSEIAARHGLSGETFDVVDFGPALGSAKRAQDLDEQGASVLRKLVEADVLVVGSPTYKGSYTGLFKHVFDLIDPSALRGKPVVITATGGGERHALMVEHQMRPLFGFFEALAAPTAIYATDRDFADGTLVSEAIRARTLQAIDQIGSILEGRHAGLKQA